MEKRPYKVMIVAGEASGDLHAAKLVKAFRESRPSQEFVFFGAAGERMRDAGVEAVVRADGLSIVGIPEIARALPMFLHAFASLKRAALEHRPDVVLLVDFPDFNLRLARALSKLGLKIVYYISPQLWAWRSYRIRTIRKYVDLVISILPFEKEWYARRGVRHVEYVGSPVAREVNISNPKDVFCEKHGLNAAGTIISLLPGSRHKEIARILPVMLETTSMMERQHPDAAFIIALASEKHLDEVRRIVRDADTGKSVRVICGETFDALNASDVGAVTSGTATLETGIIGTPMAIVYKTSALNYKLLRPLIDVEHFGLINLIAGERVASELIQDDFTAASLSAELERLLGPEVNSMVRTKLREAVDKLGQGGASRRAAEAILKLVERD